MTAVNDMSTMPMMDELPIMRGVWPATLLLAIVVTSVLSPLLLRAFRNATVRGMRKGADTATSASAPARGPAARHALAVRTIEPLGSCQAWQHGRRSVRLQQLAYVLAGSTYALLVVAAWMIASGGDFVLTRLLVLLSVFMWPLALTLDHLGALSRRGWWTYVGAYLMLTAAVFGYALARNEALTLGGLLVTWLFANGVPSAAWLAVLNHRIRAVGPLVLALAMTGSGAAFGLFALTTVSDLSVHALSTIGVALGLGAEIMFALMLLVPFAIGVVVALLGLRVLGAAYRAKRVSVRSITVDCLWLLFALWHPVVFADDGLGYALVGPLGFLAYLAVRAIAVRALATRRAYSSERLLLLRVFALDAKSRSLFACWSPTWLRVGSIALISGPDLATSTVEPHEFLAFMGGQLDREFINSREQVAEHLSACDDVPDPDGNHRINDYFCRNHTWRESVQRLAASSDRVLMDLRGFGPGNDGCAWELGELLESVPLAKVVLLVDPDTDSAHLERTISERWQHVSDDSPNVAGERAEIRVLQVERANAAAARRIICAVSA